MGLLVPLTRELDRTPRVASIEDGGRGKVSVDDPGGSNPYGMSGGVIDGPSPGLGGWTEEVPSEWHEDPGGGGGGGTPPRPEVGEFHGPL